MEIPETFKSDDDKGRPLNKIEGVFSNGECFACIIEKRKEHDPLIHLYVEDDGVYSLKMSFDVHWLPELADHLEKVKRKLRK